MSELLARGADEPLNIIRIADVAGDDSHLRSQDFHLLPRAQELLFIARTKNDFRAMTRKLLRHGQSKTTGTSGDQHHLPAKVVVAPALDFLKNAPAGNQRTDSCCSSQQ